jgi:hypothetical protein
MEEGLADGFWPTHCEVLRQRRGDLLTMDYRLDLVYQCQDGGRAAKALHEHRHHGGHQPLRGSRWLHPLPAALAIGIATIPFACGGAGFNRCAQDFVYDVGLPE